MFPGNNNHFHARINIFIFSVVMGFVVPAYAFADGPACFTDPRYNRTKGEAFKCLEDKIAKLISELRNVKAMKSPVPKNAVMAFSTTCPEGWKDFKKAKSRVLVGAGRGKDPQTDRNLTARLIGDQGGEETHTLTKDEMPSHKHRTVEAGDDGNSEWGVGSGMNGRQGVRWTRSFPTSHTGPVGGGGSQYYAAIYCCSILHQTIMHVIRILGRPHERR